jgi:thiol-disulfide isomerase/thioredoxin
MRRAFRIIFLVVAIAGTVAVWAYRKPVRHFVTEKAILANDAPLPERVEEMIQNAPDPAAAALAAWNSGHIIHRQVAARQFSRVIPQDQPLPRELEIALWSAALDPDLNVREAAFSALRVRQNSALPALAAAQLNDVDPEVRRLGLQYLKFMPAEIGVPLIMPLLDDEDPMLVATSLRLLEKWSGENFGVRVADVVPVEDKNTGLKTFREESRAKAKASAELARSWWAKHQSEFPATDLEVPAEALSAMQPVPAGDFELRTLDGRRVRLSNFRGKIVLVNCWTTWCPACLGEMPELIALQKTHSDKLVILGVSLDFVPDEDGHLGGHAAVEEQGQSDGYHDDHEREADALKRIREKVARTVRARGINYPVLLDEHNDVGGRYNGGELPTTLVVDTQGNIRRRFIGARRLPVLEAMIAEASRESVQAMRSPTGRP